MERESLSSDEYIRPKRIKFFMEEKSNTGFTHFSPPPITTVNSIKFSPREIDILACITGERKTKKIAISLSLSPRTVETYIRDIMIKLECNSRNGIIDFIEKSGEKSFLEYHYSNLLIQSEFEKSLNEVAKLNHEELTCVLLYEEEEKSKYSLFHLLQKHFKLSGLNVSLKLQKTFESFHQNLTHSPNADYFFCLASPSLWAKFEREERQISHFFEMKNNSLKKMFFLFLEEKLEKNQEFLSNNYMEVIKESAYYFLVLRVFQKILPRIDIEKIIVSFKREYEIFHRSPHSFSLSLPPNHQKGGNKKNLSLANIISLCKIRKSQGFIIILILSLLSIGLLGTKEEKSAARENALASNQVMPFIEPIRSDLIIPGEAVFLHRADLLTNLDRVFKGSEKVQTIALIGVGGAGKTTLARQYARQQKANVIWEIHAETINSLIESFENLALALSTTENDKKILRELREIKMLSEREKKIIEFVKIRLRARSNWFIIYDNLERFKDVQKYFPLDGETWGQGKVLITTQDSNIQNNKHVNRFVFVKELNEVEKLNFFTKLMNSKRALSYKLQNNEDLIEFLKIIPPFPLDIMIAVCYLNATNSSYRDYLEKLSKYNKDFTNIQLELLKEAGDYTKTRYSIVALSLQRLVSTHRDFKNLLLFVSLIHSQNIPKKLLKSYVKEDVINNFIYNLKKYSLIINGHFFNDDVTFSIHRSIQPIILSYFKQTNPLDDNSLLIKKASNSLEKYINDIIAMEDYAKMKISVNHCEAFLDHRKVLKEATRNSIGSSLGSIHFFLGNYNKSKEILEKIFENENPKIYNVSMINGLINLGNVYRELGNYEKAKYLLEESLKIYKEQFVKHYGIAVRALGSLGNVYRSLGDYKTAKELFQESLLICQQHLQKNYAHTAYALANLGNVHRELGDYEKAKYLLEKSLDLCMNYFPQEHMGVAWVMVHLGNVYRKMGNYEKAEELLTKGLLLCKKFLPSNHVRIAQISMYLGYAYKDMGDYNKAKAFLEQSSILNKKCRDGKGCIEAANVLKTLGEIYLFYNQFEKADSYFLKSLYSYQKNLDIEFYRILEEFSELYFKNFNLLESKKSSQINEYLKSKSLEYLRESLKNLKTYFPKNSLEIRRLEEKLNTRESQ